MANTLVKIYDHFANAENARNALLTSGFAADNIELAATEDEAGPMEGNFILEYKDVRRGNDKSALDSTFNRDDINEGLGHQPVTWRGSYLLTVHAEDDDQFNRASEIANSFGALDIDRLIAQRRTGE